MKHLFTVLLSVFFLNMGLAQTNPLVQEIINKVNLDSLTKYVSELSGEVPIYINGQTITITSRYYNTSTNDAAADYIKQKFEIDGLQAYDQNFSMGRNVYAVQTGTTYPDQIYIVCAHYDDISYSGLEPGADDNGSGTAAVIEAARILKDYDFKYTILYAVWDTEELGLYGSDYFAQNAYSSGMDIKGVLNMDMIAWDGNGDNKAEIHTKNLANSVALKDSMVKVNTDYSIGIVPAIINPGIGASDHASFWNYNYSAILLIEDYYGDFNPYYHSSSDLIDYFNMPYYDKCSKLTIGTLALLAGVQNSVPVELTNFAAAWNGSKVNLIWETATEKNNYGFEIQRSNRVGEFNTIAFVYGSGTKSTPTKYSFTDSRNLTSGKYFYRLKQVDYNGSFQYSKEVEVNVNPAAFVLGQNYPNPFNPSTKIYYQLNNKQFVSLKVFDVLGNEVATLVNGEKEAGKHEVKFNADNLPSGVYVYQIRTNSHVVSKKMMLLR